MRCQIGGEEAIISTSNGTFCREHFLVHFEKEALNTIKRFNLIEKGEKIAVANSGGKDSLSLLFFLSKYFKKSNEIISITIDEGIAGYRDKTIETMEKYTKMLGIKYKIYSYKDFSGMTLDEITKRTDSIPCSICGTFRRYLLNYAAMENKADKLATAHNMDDEAESIIMNLIQNNFDNLIRSGPISGVVKDEGFVTKIKPFIFLSEKETMLYSILNGILALHTPCPYAEFGIRNQVSKEIKVLEDALPGSKRKMIEKAIELKARFKDSEQKKINHCKICGAPASGEICGVCSIKMMLGQ